MNSEFAGSSTEELLKQLGEDNTIFLVGLTDDDTIYPFDYYVNTPARAEFMYQYCNQIPRVRNIVYVTPNWQNKLSPEAILWVGRTLDLMLELELK